MNGKVSLPLSLTSRYRVLGTNVDLSLEALNFVTLTQNTLLKIIEPVGGNQKSPCRE